jgi:hypothetical protein
MATDLTNFKAVSSIASLTPTAARLFGTVTPTLAYESPLESVLKRHQRVIGVEPIDRCLIFCPDALGVHIWRSCVSHIKYRIKSQLSG